MISKTRSRLQVYCDLASQIAAPLSLTVSRDFSEVESLIDTNFTALSFNQAENHCYASHIRYGTKLCCTGVKESTLWLIAIAVVF